MFAGAIPGHPALARTLARMLLIQQQFRGIGNARPFLAGIFVDRINGLLCAHVARGGDSSTATTPAHSDLGTGSDHACRDFQRSANIRVLQQGSLEF
ncbi:hypothetical protein OHC51_12390 [Stenotrophomonas indicatrix]|uniref:hypothetical protein n=1 Tax=Stenotrophomonas indicatrix TaxID=2045451 RepID=UPI00300A94BE